MDVAPAVEIAGIVGRPLGIGNAGNEAQHPDQEEKLPEIGNTENEGQNQLPAIGNTEN